MKKIILLISLFIFNSCSNKETRYLVIPENLIEKSSDKVSFTVDQPSLVSQVTDWVEDERPTSVSFSCQKNNSHCLNLRKDFSNIGISTYNTNNSTSNQVVLHYDKSKARDCDQVNLGCSVSANALQMVPDYNQFFNPPLSDYKNAEVLK